MNLDLTQKTTLRANIVALSAAGQPLEGMPQVENWAGIVEYYNANPIPAVNCWNPRTPAAALFDAIDFTQYTPNDATTDATQTYNNRAQAILIKQANLQLMLVGKDTIDMSKANIRAGLKDATTGLPSGNSGANRSATGTNGVNILNAGLKALNRVEALFAVDTATTGTITANIRVVEGTVNEQLISDVWNNR